MALLQKLKALLSRSGASQPVAPGGQGKATSKKVILVGGLLVLSILVMAALLSLETVLSRQGKNFHSILLEQQVVSQEIVINSLEAVSGNA